VQTGPPHPWWEGASVTRGMEEFVELIRAGHVRSRRLFITKMAVAPLEASENYTAIFSAVFWSGRSNKTLLNPCFEKLIA
jgi:hypothetical protein